MPKTKAEYIQRITEDYRDAGEPWPATSKMIAGWAVRHRRWEPRRRSLIDLCAKDIAYGLREEVYTDPQGRRVRRKHAVPELRELPDGTHEQQLFWVDMLEAAPEQMQAAFQLRRMQILGDCRHLKTDVDSYNDNNKHGGSIQMCFDFAQDLAELEQPSDYAGI